MAANEEVFCPKCDSIKVVTRLVELPKVQRISMDELPTRRNTISMPAVLRYRRYEAECQDCHHKVSWSEPTG